MEKLSHIPQNSPPNHIFQATLELWGQAGTEHLIPITGDSMLPLIREGDQVLVTHGGTNLQQGDVVVFRQGGKTVVHRVLRVKSGQTGSTYITKGDNVWRVDAPVKASEIIGRVLVIKRGNRSVSLDTPHWRKLGRLTAFVMLVMATPYGWCRALKHRVRGNRADRLTVFLSQSSLVLFRFGFKAILKVVRPWRDDLPAAQIDEQHSTRG
jgi:signal peptidase I